MPYWWLLERKSYKDEPIKLKPRTGEKIQRLWATGVDENGRAQDKVYIPDLKLAISLTDIKAIGPSTEVMPEDNIFALPSGLDDLETKPYGKGKAIFTPDYEQNGVSYKGAVMCSWYKKNVDRREWDSYYSKFDSTYFRMDDPDGACWVAMLLPEEKNSSKPSHLTRCTEAEDKYLYGKLNG